eukprot:scaffold7687_cov127-Isochrysis_galbana.AAC.4
MVAALHGGRVARGESPPISIGWEERPQPDSRAAPRGRCSSVEGRGMNICVRVWSISLLINKQKLIHSPLEGKSRAMRTQDRAQH